MPTYQNTTANVIVYKGTTIEPNNTIELDYYLSPYWIDRGLQLIDHSPVVSPVLLSAHETVTAGSSKTYDVSYVPNTIQIELDVLSGNISLYFNDATTNPVVVTPETPFKIDELDFTNVNRLILTATADSTYELRVLVKRNSNNLELF